MPGKGLTRRLGEKLPAYAAVAASFAATSAAVEGLTGSMPAAAAAAGVGAAGAARLLRIPGKRETQRLRRILDFAGQGVYAVDADGHCTMANEAAARMLGTDVASLIGRPIHLLHHRPEEDGGATCRVCAPIATGMVARGDDEVFRRTDGTAFPVEFTSTSTRDLHGLMGIVTFSDISERKRAEESLRQSELKFRAVAESTPDGMISSDADGAIVAWNRGAQAIFGYTEAEVLGRRLTMIMPERYRAAHDAGMARFLATRSPRAIGTTVEVAGLHKDGTEFPIELSLAHWERDGAHFFTGIIRDITDRKRSEAAISREAAFVRLLQMATEAANTTTDSREALASSLALICEHTRWPVGHVYLHHPGATAPLVSADIWHLDDERFDAFRLATDSTTFLAGEGLPGRVLKTARPAWISDVTADGNFPRAQVAGRLGLRAAFALPVLTGREVTAVLEFFGEEVLEADEALCEVMGQIGIQLGRVVERERSRKLAHHALHDALTGLPNRTLFLDRLGLALTRSRRRGSVGVLFVDLDRFKFVNDSLGHEAGDRLLVTVAARLGTATRAEDTVARFGGDEFVVLCEDLQSEDDAVAVAERIAESLAAPIDLGEGEAFVSASVGIAIARPGATASSLLRDADAALYRAKEQGRARHEMFNELMRERAVRRLETVNALHRAIERSEMELHYQPQVRLADGRVVGAEALVRWRHPDLGLVPPMDFIPLAEETGLIVPLGAWILREACRQAAEWNGRVPEPIVMSVNLSARQLQQPSIAGDVRQVLEETQLDPAALVLEITETVLMQDAAAALDRLNALKALGVRLAIDDFGTGYSSLTYLQQFPIDVLKVDRSFTESMGGDAQKSAIAHAILRLAQTLRLETVAEGVERSEHVEELRRLACDRAQGYFFARPLHAGEFEALLVSTVESAVVGAGAGRGWR